MTFDRLFSRLILLEAEERHTPRGRADDPKSVLLGRSFSPRGFASQSSMPLSGGEIPEQGRFERGSLLERNPDLGDAVKGNMRDEDKAVYNDIARAMKFAASTPPLAIEVNNAFKPYIELHSQMIAYKQMAAKHAVRTGKERSGQELRQQVPKRIDQLLDLEAAANDAMNTAETERNSDAYAKAADLRDGYREYIAQYEREVGVMLDEAKKIAGKLTVVADATLAKISKIISDAQPVSEIENKQYIRKKISKFADFVRSQRDAIKDGSVPVGGRAQNWWFTIDPVRYLFGIWNGVRNKGMSVMASTGKRAKSTLNGLLQSTKAYLEDLSSPLTARKTADASELASRVAVAQSLHDDANSLKYIYETVSSAFKPRLSIIRFPFFMKNINNLKNVDDEKKSKLAHLIDVLKDDTTTEYQGGANTPSAEVKAKQLIMSIVDDLSQRDELQSTLTHQSAVDAEDEKRAAREREVDDEIEKFELGKRLKQQPMTGF